VVTRVTRNAVPLVLGAFAAAVLMASFSLSSTARLVPASVSALVLALLAVELLSARPAERPEEPGASAADVRREMLWLLALPLVIAIAGLTAGLPIFLTTYLRLRARTSWTTALIPAGLCWIVLDIVLHRVLGVTLS
jgi:hypothetical protein